jgi:ankyrin repeat protein
MKIFRLGLLIFVSIVAGCRAGNMNTADYFSDAQAAALAQAAAKGHTDEIARLLSEGVDVNARGKDGMTPLLWALFNQNKEGFECLLQHGANPNLQLSDDQTSELARELPFAGNSAMSFAARYQDIWYLDTVIKYGGNVNLVNPFRSFTPIYASIEALRKLQPRKLIEAGANLNFQDRDGVTPLVFAAMCNRYDLAYEMLQAGADPTIKNKWGKGIEYFINQSKGRTTPEVSQWRDKVVELLHQKQKATGNQ